ncbi:SDR family NAD(P)-dependent oxidoreductase [Algirhabdus cladophorae]|uniref:SDR family NAD(P)-dependent oxidoreductase n=1 Tax=Algirhabdus cladophorae TaxID=3377108 RepID=UPI003B84762D
MLIKDTCAIVTGGASGLGAATAARFRNAGAKMFILDRQEVPDGAVCDVTNEASVADAVTKAKAAMGQITCVVNCAGIATGEKTVGRDGPHRLDSFQRTIDINLVGTFNVTRLAAAEMAQNTADAGGMRGVVISTASIAAFDGQMGQTAYAASKAGIAGLQLPMARDLARSGIRTMAIAPGVFMTPMLEGLGPEITDALAADVTFPKRLGMPDEYAALAQFIVECDYLNGETIRLDGALRMK